MSKDEAIKELTELLPEEFLSEYTDAIKMGIEALKQEPCGDAVSRQAVLETIDDDNRNGHYSCFATNNDAECFKQIIRELPSVTAQPKIGYWEWLQYDGNPKIGNFHCSLCHSIGRTYFDYCPYCGAKMSEIPTGAEGSDKE